MKQLLTFVLFVLVSLSASAQKRIDYDYAKYFIADYVWIDYNQNEDIDAGDLERPICNHTKTLATVGETVA